MMDDDFDVDKGKYDNNGLSDNEDDGSHHSGIENKINLVSIHFINITVMMIMNGNEGQ